MNFSNSCVHEKDLLRGDILPTTKSSPHNTPITSTAERLTTVRPALLVCRNLGLVWSRLSVQPTTLQSNNSAICESTSSSFRDRALYILKMPTAKIQIIAPNASWRKPFRFASSISPMCMPTSFTLQSISRRICSRSHSLSLHQRPCIARCTGVSAPGRKHQRRHLRLGRKGNVSEIRRHSQSQRT